MVIAGIIMNILSLPSYLPRQVYAISSHNYRFVVDVLHVYTRGLKITITFHHIAKVALVHKSTSSTHPINRTVTLDFGTIPDVRIGDSYEICIGTTHSPSLLCTVESISSSRIQHTNVDVNDIPE